MSVEWAAYILASLGPCVLTIGVGFYSWRKRPAMGAVMITVMCAAATLWAFCNVLQAMSTDLAALIFLDNVKTLGIVVIPVAWFGLSLEYSGYRRLLTRRFWLVISLQPVAAVVMAWTDHLHGLVRLLPRIDSSILFPVLQYELGAGLLVSIAYGYALLALGGALFVWKMLHLSQFYYPQIAAILGAMIIPTLIHVLWTANMLPFHAIDVIPIAFSFSALLFSWAVLRQGLLGIVPLALNVTVRSMNDGMIVLDTEHRVVHLNQAMEQMVGHTTIEMRGSPAEHMLSDWPELQHIASSLEHRKTEITKIEGSTQLFYEVHVSPLRDKNDDLVGTLIVLHDITDIRRAQEELQRHTLELKARNEELDAFAHTVAHGLKNPLQLIVSHCELVLMLQSEIHNERILSALNQIESASHKMSEIIESLMFLGGIRKEALTLEPLDMARIIDEVKFRLGSMIEEYKAEIIAPNVWPVSLGYAPWVEEIWDNYISNAIKYGGTKPRVETGGEDLGDGMVRFWVRDSGIGIPEEKQTLVFSPFVHFGEPGVKGHGLGLSIVERLVKKLGGTIGVESSVGSGSTFFFILPRPPKEEGSD